MVELGELQAELEARLVGVAADAVGAGWIGPIWVPGGARLIAGSLLGFSVGLGKSRVTAPSSSPTAIASVWSDCQA